MLITLGRYRRAFAGGTAALAVLLAVLDARDVPGTSIAFLVVLLALAGAWIAGLKAHKPEVLVPVDGTLATPPDGQQTLNGLFLIWACTFHATSEVADLVQGRDANVFTLVITALALVAWAFIMSLKPGGLRLSPEGILLRDAFSEEFIPWEAGVSAVPDTYTSVALTVERPELITAHRVRSRHRVIVGADPGYVCLVIQILADDPQARAEIGSPGGPNRLASI